MTARAIFLIAATAVPTSVCFAAAPRDRETPIDRHALVSRHAVALREFRDDSPLGVGNGEFVFNFDLTGLQTFPVKTPGAVPLATMSQWAWHSFPESLGVPYEAALREYTVHGRTVSYATDMDSDAAKALRSNPHRFNLGRITLRLTHQDGRPAVREDIVDARQVLDLWTGVATSRFKFDGVPVTVRTTAHPRIDAVAISVESALAGSGRLAVDVSFSYPSGEWGPWLDDWTQPERHETQATTVEEKSRRETQIERILDARQHRVIVTTPLSVEHLAPGTGAEDWHRFGLRPTAPRLEAVFQFHPDRVREGRSSSYEEIRQASEKHWEAFWTHGGAIDLSGSSDPRWRELERRIVLSQYLTAIHCSGSMPPQETGLVCNSWFGKQHLEMHWWHAAHFALWNRAPMLERSLDWYRRILPAARRIAERQGYQGVRWPKMTGPDGVSSPSSVGELLIWQQPHPIWMPKLLYDADPSLETLELYWPIVESTADFMASYAFHDSDNDRYVLGPLLVAAQESYSGLKEPGVLNPTFELAYWRWALEVASEWRERLGMPPDPQWIAVAKGIAKPTIRGGVYTAIETRPYTIREDHPSMLAAFGMLPDVGLINHRVMDQTLSDVLDDWDWQSTWGWDYPMAAMTAARLGRQEDAVALLLRDSPKNGYLPNGHCWQEDRLPAYLPANGGLLYAAALMAAGWEGADASRPAPGFPDDGSWVVRYEDIRRAD